MATKHTILKSTGDGQTIDVMLTRNMAIKAFCSECMGWETNPKQCTSILCPLYPFRGRTMLANGSPKKVQIKTKPGVKRNGSK